MWVLVFSLQYSAGVEGEARWEYEAELHSATGSEIRAWKHGCY